MDMRLSQACWEPSVVYHERSPDVVDFEGCRCCHYCISLLSPLFHKSYCNVMFTVSITRPKAKSIWIIGYPYWQLGHRKYINNEFIIIKSFKLVYIIAMTFCRLNRSCFCLIRDACVKNMSTLRASSFICSLLQSLWFILYMALFYFIAPFHLEWLPSELLMRHANIYGAVVQFRYRDPWSWRLLLDHCACRYLCETLMSCRDGCVRQSLIYLHNVTDWSRSVICYTLLYIEASCQQYLCPCHSAHVSNIKHWYIYVSEKQPLRHQWPILPLSNQGGKNTMYLTNNLCNCLSTMSKICRSRDIDQHVFIWFHLYFIDKPYE